MHLAVFLKMDGTATQRILTEHSMHEGTQAGNALKFMICWSTGVFAAARQPADDTSTVLVP